MNAWWIKIILEGKIESIIEDILKQVETKTLVLEFNHPKTKTLVPEFNHPKYLLTFIEFDLKLIQTKKDEHLHSSLI